MSERLLLCTDLDRTLLPNGEQAEFPASRAKFSEFVANEAITLAYVTGRDLGLLLDAVDEYDVPVPDYAITDVGTCIYKRCDGRWQLLDEWLIDIDRDWNGYNHQQLKDLFSDVDELVLQSAERQNRHKLSYNVSLHTDVSMLLSMMNMRLKNVGVRASLVWSIDEQLNIGLLDVLPENATKVHAVNFIRQQLGYGLDEIVFSGDSGNDLAVLCSDIPSVLVANAHADIKEIALEQALANQHLDALYIADGSHLMMNGYYSAGILEGVWHFMPTFRQDLEIIVKGGGL